MSVKESNTNKKYSNAYFKRPTMSMSDSVALAKERNKKQDKRKKEINEAAKKFKVGGKKLWKWSKKNYNKRHETEEKNQKFGIKKKNTITIKKIK